MQKINLTDKIKIPKILTHSVIKDIKRQSGTTSNPYIREYYADFGYRISCIQQIGNLRRGQTIQ